MSATVKIPGDATPRFPPRCVLCLEPADERREAEWRVRKDRIPVSKAGVATAGMPRSALYVKEWIHTIHISGIPYCRDHAAEMDAFRGWDEVRRSVPGASMGMRYLYVLGLGTGLAIVGAIVAGVTGPVVPMWGAVFGFAVGAFLGAMLLRARRARAQKRAAGDRPHARRGLHVTANVKATPTSGSIARVSIAELVFTFANRDYAPLFREANGLRS